MKGRTRLDMARCYLMPSSSYKCDQMARLFLQHLAMYINENLPNTQHFLPKNVWNFDQILPIGNIKRQKCQRLSKFCQSGEISVNSLGSVCCCCGVDLLCWWNLKKVFCLFFFVVVSTSFKKLTRKFRMKMDAAVTNNISPWYNQINQPNAFWMWAKHGLFLGYLSLQWDLNFSRLVHSPSDQPQQTNSM